MPPSSAQERKLQHLVSSFYFTLDTETSFSARQKNNTQSIVPKDTKMSKRMGSEASRATKRPRNDPPQPRAVGWSRNDQMRLDATKGPDWTTWKRFRNLMSKACYSCVRLQRWTLLMDSRSLPLCSTICHLLQNRRGGTR